MCLSCSSWRLSWQDHTLTYCTYSMCLSCSSWRLSCQDHTLTYCTYVSVLFQLKVELTRPHTYLLLICVCPVPAEGWVDKTTHLPTAHMCLPCFSSQLLPHLSHLQRTEPLMPRAQLPQEQVRIELRASPILRCSFQGTVSLDTGLHLWGL
jgi:hypothetical protein